jgi:NAD(P)-dependent dehydrogenase (short-subunit alcohol dehydrogenase family)
MSGTTMVMSGGSRGIGFAIAETAARRGANVVLLAKTDQPHPKLPGTVHSAAEQLEHVGGHAEAVVGDVRSEEDVERAVQAAIERFGGVDLCVNNASVLALAPTEKLEAKRFDLMHEVNVRGTYLLTKACLPHLRKSARPHILTLSPPLNFSSYWLGAHPGYMVAKYGMTLLTLGWAAEFAEAGIHANCLWPETTIATAAVVNLLGGQEAAKRARDPQIVADAAMEVLVQSGPNSTGRCLIDAEVLSSVGVQDMTRYGGGEHPDRDIFVD